MTKNLFIKPIAGIPYSELRQCAIIDNNNIVDKDEHNIIITFANGVATIIKNGSSIIIRKSLYEAAANNNEMLSLNFATGKARRVSGEKIVNNHVNVNQDCNADTNISNFDVDESIVVNTTKLKDIEFDPRLFVPIKTGTYLDQFVSHEGGFMPGSNIMLTGDPGVGKSSNLMDILVNVHKEDPSKKLLYISAEMNEIDVKGFEKYYPGLEDIEFLYIGKYVTDPSLNIKPYQALLSVLNNGYDIVVLDSLYEIQSMVIEDLGISAKKGERWLLDLLNKHNAGYNKANIYSTFLCIQQKNKGGSYVGSKRLEHMTSAFLNLCWDAKEAGKRYMVFEKNRKGKEKVKLYYNFTKDGIKYDISRHNIDLKIINTIQTLDENDDLMPRYINFTDMFNN